MSIFVDENTKVIVQGLTGGQGRFHGLRNRDYGTKVVGGVTPGKGGTDVDGIPVFNSVKEAVEATGATASFVVGAAEVRRRRRSSRPPRAGSRSSSASPRASRPTTRRVTYNRLVEEFPGVRLLGPNCPGIISPGKCNIGITSGDIALAGGPVGIVSRSGTLTYQALHELSQQGIGQTTCVGIGGDPVPGTNFIDCLAAFEADPETKAVMMIGEIGGSEEERAAEWIKHNMTKPVVSYIAGVTAPPGRKMGHAGAIISGSKGTAQAKMDALREAGRARLPEPHRGRPEDGRDRQGAVARWAMSVSACWSRVRAPSSKPWCDAGIDVALVASDRPCRGLEVAAARASRPCSSTARDFGGFAKSFDREGYSAELASALTARDIDLVAMAGFGTVLTAAFHEAFPGRVLNTHPSLLPDVQGLARRRPGAGGGRRPRPGCTVHVATEALDDGPILAQRRVAVLDGDDEATLHERIKTVERDALPAGASVG